ncbi:pyridoxamine 5'-phosphate oxidase family protein [Actinomycetospora sp.]|uniref:pyridoxamine 5'-phosphate oxidase family protein n=1 Tax=Actinomycetospora sp. TaxID=1872135 RepID=UPI002F40A561
MTPDTDRVGDQRTDEGAGRGAPGDRTVPVPQPRGASPAVDDSPTGEVDVPRRRGAADVRNGRADSDAGPEDSDPGPEDTDPGDETDLPEDDDEELGGGPLRGDVLGRIAGATAAVLATADRDGVQDISVLGGSRCFLRVLDRHRFAFPDSGDEPTTAARANLAETPAVGMLLLVGGTRRALHLNGTAAVVPAEELRAEDPTVPEHPIPGEPTDVWVVVEVGDLYPLDGEEAPRLADAPAVAAPAPASSGRRGRAVVAALVALAVVCLAVVGVASVVSQPPVPAAAPPPPAPVVDPGPTGPATLRGQVTEIRDPATVVVDVAGRPVTVGIVGLDAATVPDCARAESTDFARRTLDGQTVTLVPDPTLPVQPGVTRAYAVLGSQLSYTDAAIRGGHAPAAGPSQYGGVFDGEQTEARDAGVGMWGPPCVR